MFNGALSLHLPDETVDLEDSKWEDIHVTTGALKMFFRELPEPLFTYASFNDFVEAISKSPPSSIPLLPLSSLMFVMITLLY